MYPVLYRVGGTQETTVQGTPPSLRYTAPALLFPVNSGMSVLLPVNSGMSVLLLVITVLRSLLLVITVLEVPPAARGCTWGPPPAARGKCMTLFTGWE